MTRLATLPPLILSLRLALTGCAIPYTCDEPPLSSPPDGGIDPTLPTECLGRCDPDRCIEAEHYDPTTCDCRVDPRDAGAFHADASPNGAN